MSGDPGPPARDPSGPGPAAPGSPPGSAPFPFGRVLIAVPPGPPNPRVRDFLDAVVRAGAEATVCHVVLRSTTGAADATDGAPANPEELGIVRELRRGLLGHLPAGAREVPIRILHGDPGERIVEYAAFSRCDLIVLGPRARPSLGAWLRGSVSRSVAGNSRCSVLWMGD